MSIQFLEGRLDFSPVRDLRVPTTTFRVFGLGEISHHNLSKMEFRIWSFVILALVGSTTGKTWSYNLTLSSIWGNGGMTDAR
jgi:hypothetical protein